MPLFQIQDDDRPVFVIAVNFEHALTRYETLVRSENDGEYEPPKGVAYLADDDDILA